jgi:hypothetical protein
LEINKAITNNQKLIGVMVNGVYTIQADDASEYLNSEKRLTLNPKDPKTLDPKKVLENKKTGDVSNLTPNQIIGEAKNLPNVKSLNTKTRTKRKLALQREFVKKYMEENPGATIDIATKEFNKQIAG